MNRFRKTAVAAIFGIAALGLTGVAQAVFVQQTFTYDETRLALGTALDGDPDGAGGFTNGFVREASGFTGIYNELLTIDSNDGSFDAIAYWNAGGYNLDGAPTSNNVEDASGNAQAGYGLYVLFESSGFATPTGFAGETGEISFWLDPLRNSTFGFDSNDAADGLLPVGNAADDIKIGSSTVLRTGAGTFTPGEVDLGSFTLIFDEFILTAEGSEYWIDPVPFFELLRVSGQFDTSDTIDSGVAGRDSFSITNSSANGQFGVEIPTPGVIGLFGIGLVGLGLVARRRKPIAS